MHESGEDVDWRSGARGGCRCYLMTICTNHMRPVCGCEVGGGFGPVRLVHFVLFVPSFLRPFVHSSVRAVVRSFFRPFRPFRTVRPRRPGSSTARWEWRSVLAQSEPCISLQGLDQSSEAHGGIGQVAGCDGSVPGHDFDSTYAPRSRWVGARTVGTTIGKEKQTKRCKGK